MISFPSLCLGNLLASAPRAHWGNDWGVGALWGRNPQGGGWGMLFWSPWRQGLGCEERGARAASPLPSFVLHLTMVLCLYGGMSFFHEHPWLWPHHTPAPWHCLWAASSSHLQVCPLNPRLQLPAPICAGGRASRAGTCRVVDQIACAGLSLFCLQQTNCCVFLWVSVLAYHPTGWGSFPEHEKFTFFQLSFRGQVLSCFVLSSFFHPTWLCGDFSHPSRNLRSSASIQ